MTGTRRTAALGLALTVAVTLVLWSVPGRVDRNTQDLLLNLLIWIGVAQAWNIIGGIGGQLSLGHSVFIGAGGYTSAMLLLKTDLGWPVALVGAGLVSAALAWVVAFPLLRLSGVAFTIGSSALALAALAWMVTWTWTGESRGLTVPLDAVPDREAKFRLIAVLAVLTCVVAVLVLRSSFGLRLMAVRDDERAAAALGVPAEVVKRRAFLLSAGLTGLVGAAVSLNQVYIEPNSMFGLTWVVTALVMVVVGGSGTAEGPVLGAFVIYYLVNRSLEDQPMVQAILSGVLVIVVIVVAPRGIAGLLRSGVAWIRGRRTAPRTMAEAST
ncbi:branched-chain amino acid ABC transporter permease [Nocardioides sp. SYSU D00038]|uniref:branched-chain amino acid ABC transporter permease n=1 Tax=Nocardioides sp. SYSU D00038 TaxID=2812554 RepID=UPI0019678C15|nr:branched-chain amino acid ABC transporter permease [Nocardioides sp. SYSU D00038]